MSESQMPHDNHEKHLCYLDNVGYVQQMPEAYKDLVRDGKYVCRGCGRVAEKQENLCAPDPL